MTKISSLFLFWVTILAVFISLTSMSVSTALPGQLFKILFLPVTVYLLYTLLNHWFTRAPALNFQSGWPRLLIYYCFIMSATLVVTSLLAVETMAQLVSTLIFSPLVGYFFALVWPRRSPAPVFAPAYPARTQPAPASAANLDADRRDFLKLIGTAGISIFLYNLFLRRDSNLLFSGSPAPTAPLAIQNAQGEVINPAEKSPTQGYYISQIDDSPVAYFGFINNLGQWFIMRQETDDSYRYSKGDKDFIAAWSNRAKLTYDYFDNVF